LLSTYEHGSISSLADARAIPGVRRTADVEKTMPRFHMNIRHGDELVEDEEGSEFPSLTEAQREAVKSARELMAARVASGQRPNHSSFEITDTSGRVVLVMPFQEAFDWS
jgi:hypothetical protein